ncbi:Uncharacterized protein conserved in bacteria [Burkholderia pseudomallei]|nr:Uncharacterized protein conserved in bacteria [Burkholderia pseudomallei]CAJ3133297.1 Uncharacterized protein conserved in bacteria [Burkholderia pseudomallei]CAJ3136834.1 Uncharacterized protein conserved in bacteria [Burkholderia pseudomallei]CAJ3232191.1 Uncharacterized protein conserved in bacteria [Burkholderia pseudomallei]CAJ3277043.1 Uncharacterized protein conserved in bacteria [Burkholderia pseudomallei]
MATRSAHGQPCAWAAGSSRAASPSSRARRAAHRRSGGFAVVLALRGRSAGNAGRHSSAGACVRDRVRRGRRRAPERLRAPREQTGERARGAIFGYGGRTRFRGKRPTRSRDIRRCQPDRACVARRRGGHVVRYAGAQGARQVACAAARRRRHARRQGRRPGERAWLIESSPDVFYVTDRYVGWPIVLVRLSAAQPDMVKALPLRAWRAKVPAKWRDAAA